MDMVPIEIPAPLHQQLLQLAGQQGRALEEMVREFLADGLCRQQGGFPHRDLLEKCYRVMAQDNQAEGEGYLSLQDEAMG